jgi:hypothetical protein
MTNQSRPGTEHTRVASSAAMRARNVSRDPEAEARGLRAGRVHSTEPAAAGQDGQPEAPQPPAERPDS